MSSMYSEINTEIYDVNISDPRSKRIIQEFFRGTNKTTKREKLAIMNRHKVGRTIYIEPRPIINMLTASFSPGSQLIYEIMSAADTSSPDYNDYAQFAFPDPDLNWNYQLLKDRIEFMLKSKAANTNGTLDAGTKMHLILMLQYGKDFDDQPFEEGRRTSYVMKFATFYIWFIHKMLFKLTGLGPRLAKNRIAHFMKRNPHARFDPNTVTAQMEAPIPWLSWLEREASKRSTSVTSNVHSDSGTAQDYIVNTSSTHPIPAYDSNGVFTGWTTDASTHGSNAGYTADGDESLGPQPVGLNHPSNDAWFLWDDIMDYDFIRLEGVFDRFVRSRYGERTVEKEGLEFWRGFESVFTEKVSVFSPVGPSGNLDGKAPLGEEGVADNPYDIIHETRVELALNHNAANASGGDIITFTNNLDVIDKFMGIGDKGVFQAPVWVVSKDFANRQDEVGYNIVNGTIDSLNIVIPYHMIGAIKNFPQLTVFEEGYTIYRNNGDQTVDIDDHSELLGKIAASSQTFTGHLRLLIEGIQNDLYTIKSQLVGPKGELLINPLQEGVKISEIVTNGLNGGSESGESRPEIAEFFAIEEKMQAVLNTDSAMPSSLEDKFDDAGYRRGRGEWRMNQFIFEGVVHNALAANSDAHDLTAVLDQYAADYPSTKGKIWDLFWQPMFTGRPLLPRDLDDVGRTQFYVRKSFLDSYISKIPSSLQFTMMYLLGKLPVGPTNYGLRVPDVLNAYHDRNAISTAYSVNTLVDLQKIRLLPGCLRGGQKIDTALLSLETDHVQPLAITTLRKVNETQTPTVFEHFRGDMVYPMVSFDVYFDAFNYREYGTGVDADDEYVGRYKPDHTYVMRVITGPHDKVTDGTTQSLDFNWGSALADLWDAGEGISFDKAVWSVSLSGGKSHYYDGILPSRDSAIVDGNAPDGTSMLELRYSWYIRDWLKMNFPGLFVLGKQAFVPSTYSGILELFFRPEKVGTTDKTPDSFESWMAEIAEDPWLAINDIEARIFPKVFDKIGEVLALLKN